MRGRPLPQDTAIAPCPTAPLLWCYEVSDTLLPGEGIEVKLVMQERAIAAFEWTANGFALNCETRAEGGWFWRNSTDAPVTVSLRARWQYREMRAP